MHQIDYEQVMRYKVIKPVILDFFSSLSTEGATDELSQSNWI